MSEPTLHAFGSTHWTMVGRAGATDSERRRVLGRLLERYIPAMRSYLVGRFRFDADRAGDLLQSFLADKVLEDDVVRQADRTRGKFRAFLVRALDHFAIAQLRKEKAAKRSPSGGLVSLDDEYDGGAELDHPAPATADLFDVAWGRQVIDLSLQRMRRECEVGGRPDLWAVFEARVLGPTLHGADPMPLDELVVRLGITAAAASNLLVTAKRMFARNLREVVAAYAVDERDAEDEVRWLKQILARAGA